MSANTNSPRPASGGRILLPIILFALWAAFVLWTAWGTVSNGWELLTATDAPQRFNPFDQPAALFSVNLWGLAAGVVMPLIVANLFDLLNGKRLIFGGLALGMMLGRLISGVPAALLAAASIPKLLLFVVTPLLLLVGGSVVIIMIGLLVGAVFGFFVGIPVMIFNQIFAFEKSLQIFRYQSDGLAGYIVRAIFWLRNESMPKSPPDDSKGARFATQAEIQALHNPAPESMGFGHIRIGQPLFIKTDKHILIMASTRSGKGVTLIIPHLLRYQGSAFVLDPKGENAKATGRQRAALNQKVHYLDPFGISGKPQSRFNPLARFTPDNMEAESKALAAAFFVGGERGRDHWTAAGQQLLAAVILYVYVSADIPRDKKDLPTVRKILLGNLRPTLDADSDEAARV